MKSFVCPRCNSSFDAARKAARSKLCAECRAQYLKDYRAKNRETLKEKRREYERKNPEIIKAAVKRYRQKYGDKLNKKQRDAYKHPEVKHRKYLYMRSRLKQEPGVRKAYKARNEIWQALFRGHAKKAAAQALGCSIEEYRHYLEKQFLPGMSWENYGVHGWHIDHVIPLKAFDLTNEQDFARAFHFSNTRPLWATENYFKGSKYV